jgi:hypothetical protein
VSAAKPDSDGVKTAAAEPGNTPADLFGSTSDGMVRMAEWLDVMCVGCRRERAKDRKGIGGGSGCELVSRAIFDPYNAPMPEWDVGASPRPERLAELGDGPWPACTAHEQRKKRSDAGTRRAPRGMDPLFEMTGVA